MNDRLQLFFDNIEKINLYFGADADKFSKDLALKLTVRNIRFYYELNFRSKISTSSSCPC